MVFDNPGHITHLLGTERILIRSQMYFLFVDLRSQAFQTKNPTQADPFRKFTIHFFLSVSLYVILFDSSGNKHMQTECVDD